MARATTRAAPARGGRRRPRPLSPDAEPDVAKASSFTPECGAADPRRCAEHVGMDRLPQATPRHAQREGNRKGSKNKAKGKTARVRAHATTTPAAIATV